MEHVLEYVIRIDRCLMAGTHTMGQRASFSAVITLCSDVETPALDWVWGTVRSLTTPG